MEETPQFRDSLGSNERSQLVHDIRGSLNIVLLAAEMIERKKANLDPEYLNKQLIKIKENTQKINTMIEKIRYI